MTANVTKFFQAFMTLLQVLNAINVSGLPPKWRAGFTGALSALQAIEGIIAHYMTPAGNTINGTTGAVTSGGQVVATVPTSK